MQIPTENPQCRNDMLWLVRTSRSAEDVNMPSLSVGLGKLLRISWGNSALLLATTRTRTSNHSSTMLIS